MPTIYYEAVDNLSPSRSGFSMEGGRAEVTYYVDPGNVEYALTDLLGTSGVSSSTGSPLSRRLPKAHPKFPWLYASSVDVQGCGHFDPSTAVTGGLVVAGAELEVPPVSDLYWEYPKYMLKVTFTTRPYAVLSDTVITPYTISWVDPADGSSKNTNVYPEWYRYTDWPYEPSPEVAYAQHGQMKFKTSGAAPDGNTFPGFPKVILPKATVRFCWYQVPYSYLIAANSTLVKYAGHVNQLTWYRWNPGELLYHGVRTIRRYTPPVPDRLTWSGTTSFSTAKLVDLEFIFEETVRPIGSTPSVSPAWKIAAGHNLEPWIHDGKFYYVETTAASPQPKFKSIPFELFFQNPDTL